MRIASMVNHMIIKSSNSNLPICIKCQEFPWCREIPQTCPKEAAMEKRIKIWLDGSCIDDFEFDFDNDMDEDAIYQAVVEYVYGNIDIEII